MGAPVTTEGVDTTNPNYPTGLGTRDKDGDLHSFTNSRVLPIAIGRWFTSTVFRV